MSVSEGVDLSPDKRFAYCAGVGDTSSVIAQFRIAANGTLHPLTSPTVPCGNGIIRHLLFSHQGTFAYLVNGDDNTISEYRVKRDGSLSPLEPPITRTQDNPLAVFLHPKHDWLYVLEYGGKTISQYQIGASGTLSLRSRLKIPPPVDPTNLAFNPAGTSAYVSDWNYKHLLEYQVSSDGRLVERHSDSPLPSGEFLKLDPTGRYAYTLFCPTLYQYRITPSGSLQSLAQKGVTLPGPDQIVFSPHAPYAYVVNYNANLITPFRWNNGVLTPFLPRGVPAGPGPGYLTISADGRYLYVLNKDLHTGRSTISQFRIVTGGGLEPLSPATVPTGGDSRSIATSGPPARP